MSWEIAKTKVFYCSLFKSEVAICLRGEEDQLFLADCKLKYAGQDFGTDTSDL